MNLDILILILIVSSFAYADNGSRANLPELSSQSNHSTTQDPPEGNPSNKTLPRIGRRGDGDWMEEYAVASDEIWTRARNRGCSFFSAFGLSDHEAAQQLFQPPLNTIASPWKDFGDISSWGFTQTYDITEDLGAQTEFERADKDGDFGWGIGNALRGLNVDDRAFCHGGLNKVTQVVHGDYLKHIRNEVNFDQQSLMRGNRRIRATGGRFLFSINPFHGVLMGMDLLSIPSAAAQRNPPVQGNDLPDINKMSDILFLYWKFYTDNAFDTRNIRYFFMLSVSNHETLGIIKRAFPNVDWSYFPEWPGVTFEGNQPEFRAILGSPNGRSFAFFLIQHKADLGNKFITKVQVFLSNTEHGTVNLCFHVADAPVS
ncbi:hypothetical protein DM02DRAFT_695477 [Periconia macrospinosa]|uniref:Uncharacterized protein n=1 Tax=Periconia macrospinosa TaxID=97972 RepID=A0A2V1D6D7_9PLEO|nr:hypothetical protein DM02DRAFT_695477 [Periconia macrospinosa]